jgi:hypothetical protein
VGNHSVGKAFGGALSAIGRESLEQKEPSELLEISEHP